MIAWIASYPRSGSTLLRIILYRCFGFETFSLYDDLTDIGADRAVSDIVGHRSHGMSARDFLAESRKSEKRVFIKTHERP
jgi:hypothetical protein